MGGVGGVHGIVGGGSSHSSPPKLIFTGGQQKKGVNGSEILAQGRVSKQKFFSNGNGSKE